MPRNSDRNGSPVASKVPASPANKAQEQADRVIQFLSNVEEHITHGRLISPKELKKHTDPPLCVEELQEENEPWQLLWELYVRCEVFLKSQPIKAKLIESAEVSMTLS